jgi:hypothetical protein
VPAYITCPKCGEPNSSEKRYCASCWASLVGISARQSAPSAGTYASVTSTSSYTPSSYASSDYSALRGIASLCTGLGWLIVGLSALGALRGLFIMFGGRDLWGGFLTIGSAVIVGGFFYIILRIIAESISVLLDIEANTRQSAVQTQRMTALLEQQIKKDENNRNVS